jgi:uncharacterized protein YcbX
MAPYTITNLFIYPVKGLKGIEVDQVIFREAGLQYDRRWMIVDSETNRFISQRTHPFMSLMTCSIDDQKLTIYIENDSVSFDLDLSIENEMINVTVWSDTVPAYEVDKSVSYWLGKRLGLDCKLVKISDDKSRRKYYGEEKKKFTHVSFADGYPALIIGTASIKEINQRCPVKINLDRFRPNIVVETEIPHEEDVWSVISTENVTMEIIKPCVRCQVINIDQDTSASSLEPTKTLAQYRLTKDGIIFGANTICLSSGTLKKGDLISKLKG